jgi:hypothetical protein
VLGHDGSKRLDVNSDVLLAYAVDGPARTLPRGGPSVHIDYRELLQCNDPQRGRWIFSGGPVIVVQIQYDPAEQ